MSSSQPCEAFAYIGQDVRHCDRCGRPTWEHTADQGSPRTPFGSDPPPIWPRSPEQIARDAAITAGLASGELAIYDNPDGGFAITINAARPFERSRARRRAESEASS